MINNRIKGVGSVAKLDAHFKVDYKNALAMRTERVDKLYNEIKIIKKLEV